MIIKLNITQKQIDDTLWSCDSKMCPIARAAQEALGPGYGVSVGPYHLNVYNKKTKKACAKVVLPDYLRQFIMLWDMNRDKNSEKYKSIVKPQVYDLELEMFE